MENVVLVGLFPEVNVLAIFFRFFCRRLFRPGHKLFEKRSVKIRFLKALAKQGEWLLRTTCPDQNALAQFKKKIGGLGGSMS